MAIAALYKQANAHQHKNDKLTNYGEHLTQARRMGLLLLDLCLAVRFNQCGETGGQKKERLQDFPLLLPALA